MEYYFAIDMGTEGIAIYPGLDENVVNYDFSNNEPFTLRACTGNSRFLIGMVGEVKIYNYSMSDANFSEQFKFLSDKWINGLPPAVYDDSLSVGASLLIEVVSDVSTGKKHILHAVSVYPNPVNDIIYIEGTGTGFYKVYNMIGIKLWKETLLIL